MLESRNQNRSLKEAIMLNFDFRPFKNALKHKAFNLRKSRGRKKSAPSDGDGSYFSVFNDPFEIDIYKILNSKAIRRLKDKTQVFSFPENPHARTRLLHTIEVATGSINIARILGLNANLCGAIAWGHDIGHTPYGHLGEKFISEKTGLAFRHDINSVTVAQEIERDGSGLNLSFEVLEGIMNHSLGIKDLSINRNLPSEYMIAMLTDKICYTFSDINDAIRYNGMEEKDFPGEVSKLGANQREKTTSCIFSLIEESSESGEVSFSKSEIAQAFERIRKWMYENIYIPMDWTIHKEVLEKTYAFLGKNAFFEDCDPTMLLSLLTDKEANRMAEIFLRSEIPKTETIGYFGIMEILPYLRGKKFNLTQPDFSWVKA
jgi:dGTP triphosphohydrolase